MEVADLIVINKDDGDNHTNVAIARHMYESALHILRRKYDEWQPRVLTCSALEKRGIDEIGTRHHRLQNRANCQWSFTTSAATTIGGMAA